MNVLGVVSLLEHRSNQMVESQNVLIKRIKYSLDSPGHKLITPLFSRQSEENDQNDNRDRERDRDREKQTDKRKEETCHDP